MSAQVGGKESEVKAVLKQQFIHIQVLFNEGLGEHSVFLKQSALLHRTTVRLPKALGWTLWLFAPKCVSISPIDVRNFQ